MSAAIRVLLVDDHEIVRAGIAALLAREPDVEVVGMAGSGEEGLALVQRLGPDVAVVDYRLPVMSGVDLCEKLTAAHPDVGVVMLTSYLDQDIVRRAIRAGARAYVQKGVDAAELARTIRAVADGKAVLDPAVASDVMAWAVAREGQPAHERLTEREIAVLRQVARGATTREIAEQLGLAASTVKTYAARAQQKLGCRSRFQAAATAEQRGILW